MPTGASKDPKKRWGGEIPSHSQRGILPLVARSSSWRGGKPRKGKRRSSPIGGSKKEGKEESTIFFLLWKAVFTF